MPGIEPCERPNGSDQREPTPGSESWESWEPIVPQWQLDMDGYRLQMDDMQRQEVWPNRQEQAEEAMARLLDLQAVPRIWQHEEPALFPGKTTTKLKCGCVRTFGHRDLFGTGCLARLNRLPRSGTQSSTIDLETGRSFGETSA